MIGLAVRFDLGRYHANPWGEHVNEGLVEWPPSPWRILRALYSASLTRVDMAVRREDCERALSRLLTAPPPQYSLPASTVGHTRHFMPSRAWSPAKSGEADLVFDAFRALSPDDEVIAWWDVDLDEHERDALGELAEHLGHLGRSESVCTARLVAATGGSPIAARPAGETSAGDAVDLLCPAPDAKLEDLAISVTDLRRRRLPLPPAARRVTYAVEAPEPPPVRMAVRDAAPSPNLALLHVGGGNRPGITEAVAIAQALRAALQRRFDTQRAGDTSPTLSGRQGDEPRGDQHSHAHYIALPDDAGRRVERLAVWAPEGFGSREVRALAGLSRLTVRGAGDPLPIALAALGRVDEMRIPDLLGPARHWRSLTPFGLVRHPKVRGGQLRDSPEDQVRLELHRRGMPEPRSTALIRGSWHRFRSSRVGQSRLQRARVFGVDLVFDRPVRGPIAIGALCHFGLGVFTPAREG